MNGAADTIAAIATPPGRGAVAIVRASGPQSRELARRVVPTARPLRPRVATRAQVRARDGAAIDEGLAIFFAGPHSYTGEDVLEVHVHGAPVVARETLVALFAAGARQALPGEFTRRAFLNGKLDLTAAEAVADLIAAEHGAAVRAAGARLSGGLGREAARLRDLTARLSEELSAALDFPDEVDAPPFESLALRLGVIAAALDELAEGYERGRIVREGASIAIVGRPNVGKSSLLNALLEEDRALVSEIPGTTRDTIEETVSLGSVTARIVDTAGIREAADRLEAAGIARSEAALAQAAVVLLVLDASAASLDAAERELLERTRDRARVIFFNKADLGARAFETRPPAATEAVLGSAFDPLSVAALRRRLAGVATGGATVDLARPHLGTARQMDAVERARRAIGHAQDGVAAGASIDLLGIDLAEAFGALAELEGRDVREAVLAGVFARFCVGK